MEEQGKFGSSLSFAPDVDGDGRAELLLGSPAFYDNTGMVSVLFGQKDFGSATLALEQVGDINFYNLRQSDPNRRVDLYPGNAYAGLGFGMASADLNDDGKSEVLLSTSQFGSELSVLWGGEKLRAAVSLGLKDYSSGVGVDFAAEGGWYDAASSAAARAIEVGLVGDINGDGLSDQVLRVIAGDDLSDFALEIGYGLSGGLAPSHSDAGTGGSSLLRLFPKLATALGDASSLKWRTAAGIGDLDRDGADDLLLGYSYAPAGEEIWDTVNGLAILRGGLNLSNDLLLRDQPLELVDLGKASRALQTTFTPFEAIGIAPLRSELGNPTLLLRNGASAGMVVPRSLDVDLSQLLKDWFAQLGEPTAEQKESVEAMRDVLAAAVAQANAERDAVKTTDDLLAVAGYLEGVVPGVGQAFRQYVFNRYPTSEYLPLSIEITPSGDGKRAANLDGADLWLADADGDGWQELLLQEKDASEVHRIELMGAAAAGFGSTEALQAQLISNGGSSAGGVWWNGAGGTSTAANLLSGSGNAASVKAIKGPGVGYGAEGGKFPLSRSLVEQGSSSDYYAMNGAYLDRSMLHLSGVNQANSSGAYSQKLGDASLASYLSSGAAWELKIPAYVWKRSGDAASVGGADQVLFAVSTGQPQASTDRSANASKLLGQGFALNIDEGQQKLRVYWNGSQVWESPEAPSDEANVLDVRGGLHNNSGINEAKEYRDGTAYWWFHELMSSAAYVRYQPGEYSKGGNAYAGKLLLNFASASLYTAWESGTWDNILRPNAVNEGLQITIDLEEKLSLAEGDLYLTASAASGGSAGIHALAGIEFNTDKPLEGLGLKGLQAAGDLNGDGYADFVGLGSLAAGWNYDYSLDLVHNNLNRLPGGDDGWVSGVDDDEELKDSYFSDASANGQAITRSVLVAPTIVWGSDQPLNLSSLMPILRGNASSYRQNSDATKTDTLASFENFSSEVNLTIQPLGDFNGDGFDDLAIADSGSGDVYVLFGGLNLDQATARLDRLTAFFAETRAKDASILKTGTTNRQIDTYIKVSADGFGGASINAISLEDALVSIDGSNGANASAAGSTTPMFGGVSAIKIEGLDPATYRTGVRLSAAGDFNGDGRADLQISSVPTAGGDVIRTVIFSSDPTLSVNLIGTPGLDSLKGTPAGDIIHGKEGGDIIQGFGGIDVILAGPGDDTIHLVDERFRRVDGGSGFDVLVLEGEKNQRWDFTRLASSGRVQNVEFLDLSDFGNNEVVLNAAAVSAMAGSSGTLQIEGDVQQVQPLSRVLQQLTAALSEEGLQSNVQQLLADLTLRVGLFSQSGSDLTAVPDLLAEQSKDLIFDLLRRIDGAPIQRPLDTMLERLDALDPRESGAAADGEGGMNLAGNFSSYVAGLALTHSSVLVELEAWAAQLEADYRAVVAQIDGAVNGGVEAVFQQLKQLPAAWRTEFAAELTATSSRSVAFEQVLNRSNADPYERLLGWLSAVEPELLGLPRREQLTASNEPFMRDVYAQHKRAMESDSNVNAALFYLSRQGYSYDDYFGDFANPGSVMIGFQAVPTPWRQFKDRLTTAGADAVLDPYRDSYLKKLTPEPSGAIRDLPELLRLQRQIDAVKPLVEALVAEQLAAGDSVRLSTDFYLNQADVDVDGVVFNIYTNVSESLSVVVSSNVSVLVDEAVPTELTATTPLSPSLPPSAPTDDIPTDDTVEQRLQSLSEQASLKDLVLSPQPLQWDAVSQTLTLKILRSGYLSGDLAVAYRIEGNNGLVVPLLAGSVVIPGGATSATVTLTLPASLASVSNLASQLQVSLDAPEREALGSAERSSFVLSSPEQRAADAAAVMAEQGWQSDRNEALFDLGQAPLLEEVMVLQSADAPGADDGLLTIQLRDQGALGSQSASSNDLLLLPAAGGAPVSVFGADEVTLLGGGVANGVTTLRLQMTEDGRFDQQASKRGEEQIALLPSRTSPGVVLLAGTTLYAPTAADGQLWLQGSGRSVTGAGGLVLVPVDGPDGRLMVNSVVLAPGAAGYQEELLSRINGGSGVKRLALKELSGMSPAALVLEAGRFYLPVVSTAASGALIAADVQRPALREGSESSRARLELGLGTAGDLTVTLSTALLVVPGEAGSRTPVTVSLTGASGQQMALVRVDDLAGGIDGDGDGVIESRPGDSGYLKVLAQRLQQVGERVIVSEKRSQQSLELEAGGIYLPMRFSGITAASWSQRSAPTLAPQVGVLAPQAMSAIDLDGASQSRTPSGEGAAQALDGNALTKYLNYGKANAGLEFSYGSAVRIESFVITTANDAPERDPASYALYGAVGSEWRKISAGVLSLPQERRTEAAVVTITNPSFYSGYRLVFPSLRSASAATSLQLADVQLRGAADQGQWLVDLPLLAYGQSAQNLVRTGESSYGDRTATLKVGYAKGLAAVQAGPVLYGDVVFDQRGFDQDGALTNNLNLKADGGEIATVTDGQGQFAFADGLGVAALVGNRDGVINWKDGLLIAGTPTVDGRISLVDSISGVDLGFPLVGLPDGSGNLSILTTLKYAALLRWRPEMTLLGEELSPELISGYFGDLMVGAPASLQDDSFSPYASLQSLDRGEREAAVDTLVFSYQNLAVVKVLIELFRELGLDFESAQAKEMWGYDPQPENADRLEITAFSAYGYALTQRFGASGEVNPTDRFGRMAYAQQFDVSEAEHLRVVLKEILGVYPLERVLTGLEGSGLPAGDLEALQAALTDQRSTAQAAVVDDYLEQSYGELLDRLSLGLSRIVQTVESRLRESAAVGEEFVIASIAGSKRFMVEELASELVRLSVDGEFVDKAEFEQAYLSTFFTPLLVDAPDRVSDFRISLSGSVDGEQALMEVAGEPAEPVGLTVRLRTPDGMEQGAPDYGLSVRFRLGGTAIEGVDYELAEGLGDRTLVVPAGASEVVLPIRVLRPAQGHGGRVVDVQLLSSDSGYGVELDRSVVHVVLPGGAAVAEDSPLRLGLATSFREQVLVREANAAGVLRVPVGVGGNLVLEGADGR
ncbi:FG-GAP repeat protein, partial [Cyanobium sp. T1B-Tous]|uniref:hypothetical protein n=1 Tax=Cyanobium sp. T1B-Tous TaxID=2823721 RepID=UPI0020CF575D